MTLRIIRSGRLAGAAAALGLSIGLIGPVVAAEPATAAYCGISWGSLAKSSAPMTTKSLVGVRSGRHTCYDRLVLDIGRSGSGAVGYDVRYVSAVSGASGIPIPLRGDADLQVTVRAPAYDSAGRPTYTPANRREVVPVAGYQTFRQVAWVESFEGQTTLGLGVRARLPMRVFVLSDADGSRRLVIDVAHRW